MSNPKAASTSIESVLEVFQERPDLNARKRPGFYTARHMPATEIRENLGQSVWDGLFTFGVVRHPHDWFVSQLTYNYRRLSRPVPHDRRITGRDVWQVHSLLTDRRGQPASASASQWAFLCSASQQPLVGHLTTLDDLDDTWAELTRLTGTVVPRPARLNRTRHPAWNDWLDPGACKVIEDVWEPDFALYRQAATKPSL
ncbi:hypothetical protein ACFUYE_00030 [Micromonospora humida]|uniref:hypothetical protein n=1 Tax=Micromonospora humida TaxID=2809018 RepID=UPI00366D8337